MRDRYRDSKLIVYETADGKEVSVSVSSIRRRKDDDDERQTPYSEDEWLEIAKSRCVPPDAKNVRIVNNPRGK